jgi:hypothetical protein
MAANAGFRPGDQVVPRPELQAGLPEGVAGAVGEVVLVTTKRIRVRFPSGRVWHFLGHQLLGAPTA